MKSQFQYFDGNFLMNWELFLISKPTQNPYQTQINSLESDVYHSMKKKPFPLNVNRNINGSEKVKYIFADYLTLVTLSINVLNLFLTTSVSI